MGYRTEGVAQSLGIVLPFAKRFARFNQIVVIFGH
jgi:hypothetical protein